VKGVVETDRSTFHHEFNYAMTRDLTRCAYLEIERWQQLESYFILYFCLVEPLAFYSS
jgi:hypothetical protein